MAPAKPGGNPYWDRTTNPFGGCVLQSSGCSFCYASNNIGGLQNSLGVPLYAGTTVFQRDRYLFNGKLTALPPDHPEWDIALRWPGAAQPVLGPGMPSLLWLGSMAEVFLPGRDKRLLDRAIGTLAASDHLGLLLTKRPDVLVAYISAQLDLTQELWKPKFLVGFSAEDQANFDRRWPVMRGLAEAGWLVFVSIAPMLGPVALPADFIRLGSWVIASGEQGPHRQCRPMDADWARALRDQCKQAGVPVPFFVKQMSGKKSIPPDLWIRQFPAIQLLEQS